MSRDEEATAALDTAIEINHQLPEAWNNKGKAIGGLGNDDEAIAAYDKAIEIHQQHAMA